MGSDVVGERSEGVVPDRVVLKKWALSNFQRFLEEFRNFFLKQNLKTLTELIKKLKCSDNP